MYLAIEIGNTKEHLTHKIITGVKLIGNRPDIILTPLNGSTLPKIPSNNTAKCTTHHGLWHTLLLLSGVLIYIVIAFIASVPSRKRMKFGPREGVFHIRAARKMGRKQKGGRKGVGEGKEGNACPQTP